MDVEDWSVLVKLIYIDMVVLDNLSKGRKSFVYDGDGGEVFRKFFRENASVITDGDPTTCFPSYYFRYLYRNKTTLNVDMATLQSIYQVDIFQGNIFVFCF